MKIPRRCVELPDEVDLLCAQATAVYNEIHIDRRRKQVRPPRMRDCHAHRIHVACGVRSTLTAASTLFGQAAGLAVADWVPALPGRAGAAGGVAGGVAAAAASEVHVTVADWLPSVGVPVAAELLQVRAFLHHLDRLRAGIRDDSTRAVAQ
jgi:hypothetical protein